MYIERNKNKINYKKRTFLMQMINWGLNREAHNLHYMYIDIGNLCFTQLNFIAKKHILSSQHS